MWQADRRIHDVVTAYAKSQNPRISRISSPAIKILKSDFKKPGYYRVPPKKLDKKIIIVYTQLRCIIATVVKNGAKYVRNTTKTPRP